MKCPRIYKPGPLTAGASINLGDAATAHVRKVLRLRPGDPLSIFDGAGHEFEARIAATGGRTVQVSLGEAIRVDTESPLDLTLFAAISRGQRMDMIIQKSTELGVRRIQPLTTERVVVRLDVRRAPKKVDHWQAIAIGACEQSGRATLPEILKPVAIGDALSRLDETAGAGSSRILCDADGEQHLAPALAAAKHIAVLTGPEGGLTPAEKSSAISAGFVPVRLGPRTLRAETAPLVALSLIQFLAGDSGPAD